MAILSLMHDLLRDLSPPPEFSTQGDTYSSYSFGMLFGILAVALDLIVAIIAAANVAMASHLSLRPPRKDPDFHGRLVFCMIMQLGTAMFSGCSLYILALEIDVTFSLCVLVSFIYGSMILMYQVFKLYGFKPWMKRSSKTPLLFILSIVSCTAFMLAVGSKSQSKGSMWTTTLANYLTFTYILLVFFQVIPLNHPDAIKGDYKAILFTKSCALPLSLCSFWMTTSLFTLFNSSESGWNIVTIIGIAASVLEAVLFGYVAGMAFWKSSKRQQRHTRVPTNPV